MKRKNLEIILWLACLELIRYTITRALRIGITHDEAYTFIHYVPKSFHGIVYYDPPLIPNNHILNTLLIKLSTFLFGVSEFTLRLPNLLFHLLYLIFSMWWLKGFKDKWVLIIGFILLNVNVYLLDFFSLARGYGMGAALCFISIYHTFKHKDTQRVKYIYFAFLTAALSVYANFTFLYFYLALAGLFNLIFLLQRKGFTRLLRLNIPILLVSAVLAFIIFVPLTHIQSDLFGGSSNFWDDTVYTWTYSYMYHTHYDWLATIATLVGILFTAGLVTWGISIWRTNKILSPLGIALTLLILVIMIQIVQHAILDTPYLMNRTAILYFPMFSVFLVCLFDELKQMGSLSRAIGYIGFVPLGLAVLAHSLQHFNYKLATEWRYEYTTKGILEYIQTNNPQKEQVDLGASWTVKPGILFYKKSWELDWLRDPYEIDIMDKTNDYYLVEFFTNRELENTPPNNSTLIRAYDNRIKLYKARGETSE